MHTRLHSILTLSGTPLESQNTIASISNKLGMSYCKSDMKLSFLP